MSDTKTPSPREALLGALAGTRAVSRMGRKYRSHGGRRADLGNRYFRSLWEANWARYLNWLLQHKAIQGWSYESRTFEFPVRRGTPFYTPDFEVIETSGQVVYEEIKGYMDEKSRVQLKRMSLYYPAVIIRVIDSGRYYGVAKQVSRLIPHWEKA